MPQSDQDYLKKCIVGTSIDLIQSKVLALKRKESSIIRDISTMKIVQLWEPAVHLRDQRWDRRSY